MPGSNTEGGKQERGQTDRESREQLPAHRFSGGVRQKQWYAASQPSHSISSVERCSHGAMHTWQRSSSSVASGVELSTCCNSRQKQQ
jgi:hypothetical protein